MNSLEVGRARIPEYELRCTVLEFLDEFRRVLHDLPVFKDALARAYFEGFLDPLSEIHRPFTFVIGRWEFTLAAYEYRDKNDQQIYIKRRIFRPDCGIDLCDEELILDINEALDIGTVQYMWVDAYSSRTFAPLTYQTEENNSIAIGKTREFLQVLGVSA